MLSAIPESLASGGDRCDADTEGIATFLRVASSSLAAAQLIAYNPDRIDTLCVSAPGTPHTRIAVIRGTSTGDQADVVAAIEAWHCGGRRYRDCAVLGRLWGQTLGLELALLERGIPFTKPGKDTAFQVPDVAGLLGYLRLAAGTLFEEPNAREIVRHMLGTPSPRLPNRVLDALIEAILQDPEQGALAIAAVAKTVKTSFHAEKIRERAALWREAPNWREWLAADVLRLYAARTDLLRAYARSADSDTASEKQIAYDTLLGWATRTATSVPDFLSRMADLRRTAERHAAGGDVVLISSIHQAKGREWPIAVVDFAKERWAENTGRWAPNSQRLRHRLGREVKARLEWKASFCSLPRLCGHDERLVCAV